MGSGVESLQWYWYCSFCEQLNPDAVWISNVRDTPVAERFWAEHGRIPFLFRVCYGFINVANPEGQMIRFAPCVVGTACWTVFGVVVGFQLMLRIGAFDYGEFTDARLRPVKQLHV
jgi:hypothetical protein